MTAIELNKILKTLQNKAPNGVSVFAIAKETKIEPHQLRGYLAKYTDYFVQLPEQSAYQINRFGKFKGDIDVMVADRENQLKSQYGKSSWVLYFLYTAVFISLTAALIKQ